MLNRINCCLYTCLVYTLLLGIYIPYFIYCKHTHSCVLEHRQTHMSCTLGSSQKTTTKKNTQHKRAPQTCLIASITIHTPRNRMIKFMAVYTQTSGFQHCFLSEFTANVSLFYEVNISQRNCLKKGK